MILVPFRTINQCKQNRKKIIQCALTPFCFMKLFLQILYMGCCIFTISRRRCDLMKCCECSILITYDDYVFLCVILVFCLWVFSFLTIWTIQWHLRFIGDHFCKSCRTLVRKLFFLLAHNIKYNHPYYPNHSHPNSSLWVVMHRADNPRTREWHHGWDSVQNGTTQKQKSFQEEGDSTQNSVLSCCTGDYHFWNS